MTGIYNQKNDSRPCMGASAFLKSVDFTAFEINVKTIALGKYLYQYGHAIWRGEEPRIIDTFLEAYDFSDKTIVPFATSGSSGITASENNIRNLGVEIGKQLSGKRFSA